MNTYSITKKDIIELIQQNDSNITFSKSEPSLSKSKVWSSFSVICFKNEQQQFVACECLQGCAGPYVFKWNK